MYMYKTFHPKKEKLLNTYIKIIIIIKKLGEKKKEIEITRDDHLIGAGGFIYLSIYLFVYLSIYLNPRGNRGKEFLLGLY